MLCGWEGNRRSGVALATHHCGTAIDNRILKYLVIRSPINQPYKMLPPEVESARHFDLNITQWELPLIVMRHLNSQSRHCRLDEMCVRDYNEIFYLFIL